MSKRGGRERGEGCDLGSPGSGPVSQVQDPVESVEMVRVGVGVLFDEE